MRFRVGRRRRLKRFLDLRRYRQSCLAMRHPDEARSIWEGVAERMIPFIEEAAGTGN